MEIKLKKQLGDNMIICYNARCLNMLFELDFRILFVLGDKNGTSVLTPTT